MTFAKDSSAASNSQRSGLSANRKENQMEHHELDRRGFFKAAALTTASAALGSWAQAAELYGKMPMRVLGRTGLKVSSIGVGGYHAALPKEEAESITLIHRAIDLGVNFFDNADCYHKGVAEERMGKALEGYRKKVILMTKVDQRDAAGSLKTLETSLQRLRTDYLDIWQFHSVGSLQELDQIFGPGGALETAEKARKDGKIRFIGLTGHADPQVHLAAAKRYSFDTIQMPINVLDPHFQSFRKTVVDEAVNRHTGVLAMKTLSFGKILSFKVASAAEALRWVWSQPVSVLISGCENVEQINYNVYLAKTFTPMPEDEQEALLARTEPHKGTQIENYKRSPES
jgi:aryl-alcohol dehydrogenase-like predicted oxidoreductase